MREKKAINIFYNFRGSLISGILIILLSSPIANLLCTKVEESSGTYMLTSLDSNQALLLTISFIIVGSFFSLWGIGGLLLNYYIEFKK